MSSLFLTIASEKFSYISIRLYNLSHIEYKWVEQKMDQKELSYSESKRWNYSDIHLRKSIVRYCTIFRCLLERIHSQAVFGKALHGFFVSLHVFWRFAFESIYPQRYLIEIFELDCVFRIQSLRLLKLIRHLSYLSELRIQSMNLFFSIPMHISRGLKALGRSRSHMTLVFSSIDFAWIFLFLQTRI